MHACMVPRYMTKARQMAGTVSLIIDQEFGLVALRCFKQRKKHHNLSTYQNQSISSQAVEHMHQLDPFMLRIPHDLNPTVSTVHVNQGGSTVDFQRIQHARDVLTDPRSVEKIPPTLFGAQDG